MCAGCRLLFRRAQVDDNDPRELKAQQLMKPATESAWLKSRYSTGSGGECVEAAVRLATVHVRDSKDTTRPYSP
ncbi:DUF397 domain-containing protein [Streptomyces sp. NPDC048720]|uniref:DUF397 domain-containing protein n=1 Tax=Streptomyces sp. NPDC048720 TaxID=3365588 RepID=UPI00371CC417